MVPMRSNLLRYISLWWVDMQLLIVSVNLRAAAMTLSSGVMSRLVIYLYLWNTVAKLFVALVSFVHIIYKQ